MAERRFGQVPEPLLGGDLAEGDKELTKFARNLRLAADLATGKPVRPVVVDKVVFGPIKKIEKK